MEKKKRTIVESWLGKKGERGGYIGEFEVDGSSVRFESISTDTLFSLG